MSGKDPRRFKPLPPNKEEPPTKRRSKAPNRFSPSNPSYQAPLAAPSSHDISYDERGNSGHLAGGLPDKPHHYHGAYYKGDSLLDREALQRFLEKELVPPAPSRAEDDELRGIVVSQLVPANVGNPFDDYREDDWGLTTRTDDIAAAYEDGYNDAYDLDPPRLSRRGSPFSEWDSLDEGPPALQEQGADGIWRTHHSPARDEGYETELDVDSWARYETNANINRLPPDLRDRVLEARHWLSRQRERRHKRSRR